MLECSAFRQRKAQNPRDRGGLSLPHTLVEIEDGSRLFQKQRVPRENPTSITPRSIGILAEPAPDGGSADLRYQPLSENFLPNVGDREARQGQALAMRQLTSENPSEAPAPFPFGHRRQFLRSLEKVLAAEPNTKQALRTQQTNHIKWMYTVPGILNRQERWLASPLPLPLQNKRKGWST